ncbi:MAG: PH domain-containing protein [Methanoregula sp.]|jgi:uncharacterized membrane protein YdbT with pleckstrin-like domain|uniref:PH domain-containing protein n=1 Tax=Methanoregula sp. TaxID=2052170 RepID=UPI003C1D7DA3
MAIRIPTEITLTEGEVPFWFGQMSWAANWVLLLLGLIFLIFFIGIFFFVGAWINVATSEYFISNKRIFVKYGLISRVMNDIKMEWVTNTSLAQDFFGRILNFGNVLIATPGTATGTEMMMGVANPMMVKGMIEERLVKFKKNEEIRQSIRRITDEYKMGRLDEARYNSLKQEYETEILKNS